MKTTIKTILTLILCLTTSIAKPQETPQENAIFRITYDCEATYTTNKPQTYRWHLDVSQHQTIFYCPNHRNFDIETEKIKNSSDLQAALAQIQKINKQYKPKRALEILTHEDNYTYLASLNTDHYIYTQPLPQIPWATTDSTKEICHHQCKSATATVHGRDWTVWYTEDIPVSTGPYILQGLPGTILEAYDSQNTFHFIAVGIQQLDTPTPIQLYNPRKAHKCTRAKYLKIRKANENKTYGQLLKNLGVKVVKVVDADGSDIKNKKRPTHNYLDLE